MECNQARPLIPSYLDGELSEAQAAPLRRHLLDCQPCRAGAQGEKNLKRWFQEGRPQEIPRDFAARVARRAFAGDTGDRFGDGALARAGVADGDSLRFVLRITSIAALVLIVLAIALKSSGLPSGSKLVANTGEPSLDQAIERIDLLNRAEGGVAGDARGGASGTARNPGGAATRKP